MIVRSLHTLPKHLCFYWTFLVALGMFNILVMAVVIDCYYVHHS